MKNQGWTRGQVVTVALVMGAVLAMTGCDSHPSARAATRLGSDTIELSTTKPQSFIRVTSTSSPTSTAKEFTTTGPLVAEQQSDVATERDGRIVQVAVQLGDRVQKGQLLAALDSRALQTVVQEKTAQLTSLRAQVREWEAEEKMDGADLRRADQMLASRILSQEGWEHVKYKLDEVIAEVARYRADETAAEADLNLAKLQLQQSWIVAPFNGVVGREPVRLAQEVKHGDVLFWVTAEAPLHVLFTVPESAMEAYAVGTPLVLTTAAVPGLRQQARVLRVSPVVDPASDSIQVIGALVRPSISLKPGMSMQIAVTARDQSATHDVRMTSRNYGSKP